MKIVERPDKNSVKRSSEKLIAILATNESGAAVDFESKAEAVRAYRNAVWAMNYRRLPLRVRMKGTLVWAEPRIVAAPDTGDPQ